MSIATIQQDSGEATINYVRDANENIENLTVIIRVKL